MRLLRARDHRRMAWKNGGGETAEIAVGSDGAGWAWRVSLARIAAAGPFSAFPGIDRSLAPVAGGPLRLRVGDRPALDLVAGQPPHGFSGDEPAEVLLLGEPATVLNVMTRREHLRHRLGRHELDPGDELGGDDPTTLLLCHAGRVRVATAGGAATLGPSDGLLLDGADPPWTLRATVPTLLYVVGIAPGEFTAGSGTSGRDRSVP